MRRVHNYTPASFANPSSTGQKRKRTREHFSCELCRSRKVACDRQQPCENCVKLKCPDECHYDSKHGNKSSETSPSSTGGVSSNLDLSITNARVSRLESLVERLAGKVGMDVESLHDLPPHATGATAVSQARLKRTSHSNAMTDHCAAYDALYYAGQHNWSYLCGAEMKFFWKERNAFSAQLSHFNELVSQFDPARRKTLWDFAVLPKPESASEHDLLTLLPDRKICDTMTARFLLTFNTALPLVDPKTLQESVERFWEEQHPDNLPWLTLYLAIIALGYQLPVTVPDDYEFDRNGRRTGKRLMDAIIPLIIRIAHRSRRPNLATFQAVLLIIFHEKLALDWVDGNDVTNGYLGLLSRMAVTMGLHRDPQNFAGMSESEANTRRKVFWTFTFVDLDHVLQSGMPCRYRDDGHDVDPPHGPSEGWTAYMQRIVDCIPSCEKVIRFSHSRHIRVSPRAVDELADTHRDFVALGAHSGDSDSKTPELNTICAIQRSLYIMLNERIQTVVQWPLPDSGEPAVREAAENRMLDSCTQTLESVERLTDQIGRTPAAAQEAWTHFAIALLRCSLSYAISIVAMICRRRRVRSQASERNEQTVRLHHLMSQTLRLFDKSTPISYNSAKGQLIFWAHYYTIDQRADAQDSEELSTWNLDLNTAKGRRMVATTKEAMGTAKDDALTAITEAREKFNPYPNLLPEAPRPLHKADEANSKDVESHNGNVTVDEGEMFDWLFTFDGWPEGPEMFDDVTAPWM